MNRRDSELSDALRRLPAPAPSADLLPRILRSRATGVRIADESKGVAIPWGWLGAAAAVVVLIGGSWFVSLSLSRLGSSSQVREPLDRLLRDAGMLPTKPEAPSLRGAPRAPKYGLITTADFDATRLKGGAWTYAGEVTTDEVLTSQSGAIRIRLARGSYLGSPTWVVSSARQLRGGPWGDYADTTHLDPVSLRPKRSVAHGNKYRTLFLQTFSADSGYEAIDRAGPMPTSWRGSVALPFPDDALFINDWSTMRLAVLVAALPLARGWRGSMYQVSFIANGAGGSIEPLDLRVRGTDQVTVPAGSFDCWRLEVETHLWRTERETLWVSRDEGWLIKKETRGSDYVVTTVLASYEPGT